MGTCTIGGNNEPSIRWKLEQQEACCGLKVKMDVSQLTPKNSSVEDIEGIIWEEQVTTSAPTSNPNQLAAQSTSCEPAVKKVSFMEQTAAPPQSQSNATSTMLKSTPLTNSKKVNSDDQTSRMHKSGMRMRKTADKIVESECSMSPENRFSRERSNTNKTDQSDKSELNTEIMIGVYEGAYVNGKKCGEGKESFPDGSVYEGEWKHNHRHGKGRYTRTNGDWYEGGWRCGKEHGAGVKYDSKTACTTTGTWVNGSLEGEATEEWEDGARFKGNFHNNLKNGQGRLQFADGSYYKGSFLNNEIHGEGEYSWPNSRVYVGHWAHNQMSGHGKLTYQNGCSYVGEFEMGQKQGEGEFNWADGRKYVGGWFRGKQHGLGKLVSSKGEERYGEWCEGKRVHEPSLQRTS